MHSVASAFAASITWEYTSLVVETWLCPSCLDTVTMSVPLAISTLATVWRKAWGLMCGRPYRLENFLRYAVILVGFIGPPVSCVNTYALFRQRSPQARRCSACAAR